jgi:glucose-6-phosphate 1-dehydrogenase
MKPDQKTIDPAILVIFGITGDLSKRKLLPAIYHLFKDDLIPKETVILGLTRQDLTEKDILSNVELCINEEDGICDKAALKKVEDSLKVIQIDLSKMGEFKKSINY